MNQLCLQLLLFVASLSFIIADSVTTLDGTIHSYAQFNSWKQFFGKTVGDSLDDQVVRSVSISFDFRCNGDGKQPLGGLLLYTDDESGIGGVFLEVKLLSDSNLRLRIDDNTAIRTRNIIELHREINFTDSQWHHLELTRHVQTGEDYTSGEERVESITFQVDSETIHKKIELSRSPLSNGFEHCHHREKAVFIGGLPAEYQSQYLAHLAIPTVAYERHFLGSIRNVRYSAQLEDNQSSIQMLNSVFANGTLENIYPNGSYCNLKCQHGGYCYRTANVDWCDCSATDYEGLHCHRERHPLTATFHGTLGEYLSYNYVDLPNAWSLVSSSESYTLVFRTKSANGILLLTSDEFEDYMAITIRDAGISLTMKFGSAVHEKTVKPSKVRFDDNQWHTVSVIRKIREISPSTFFCHFSITVDEIYTQYGSTTGVNSYFISKVIYVGGIVHDSRSENSEPITPGSNFAGCLRKIIITADNIRMDLLSIANERSEESNLIRFYGNSIGKQNVGDSMCDEVDVSDPITFTTEDSYLKVLGWNAPKEGALSLKFRTNEPNGVLLYSTGHGLENNGTHRDYIALELLDGHVYFLINLGSSPVKVKATSKRIDDSHWHTITVRRSGRTGQIVLDDTVSDFVSPGASNQLDLADTLYLGGFPRHTGNRLTYTPPELWSASLGFGYIGCVKDLFLNDRIVDIAAYAKRQDSGSVKPSCHSLANQCNNSPCQNGGNCTEGWNRYSCSCSHTPYTGSVCTKNAATLSFNGEQYLTILHPEELQTQSESINLRFRTKKANGLLLLTSHTRHPHHMAVLLESGEIRLDLNLGVDPVERIVMADRKLNDDNWHTVHIERRGPNLEIEVDAFSKQVVQLTGQHFTLFINSIHIGANLNLPKVKNFKRYPGFVGYMQNFVFNGQQYFEKARDGQMSSGSIRMTAKLGKKDRILHNAVTFKSKYTFVGLPQLKAYSRLNIYFQFKTREPNGLLFFNGGGQKHDFIALELVNGILHYIFDLGDGPRRIQSKSRNILNDNRWHTVTLGRPSLNQHTMLIDDTLMTTSSTVGNERNLHLDLDGLLYFGGVRDDMWASLPRAVKSKTGFEGCIASLDLNGEIFNLVGKEVLIPSTLVESGCSAPITRCSSTACANRGICVQLWNSYTCDCDLTTFSGPTCADGNESTAYQFGPNPGLISFTFDENNRPDTRNDLLALGFLTTHKNGALVRVDSATTADYLQLELLDGNVLIVYNLGTEDIDIGDLGIKVNDGQYHIVRFTRSGQNSTLQIDNHNVITKSPAGKQLNIFNRHAKIQIGGHKNVIRGTIEKPFIGIIAGLVFNGHRLLDMAAEDDPRTKIEGDVELMISINNQQQSVLTTPGTEKNDNQMLSEPKSHTYGNDDLIFSGAGSGCFDVNDDEECAHVANEGSGDELITPVYVAVNRFRPTTESSNQNHVGGGWRRPCQNDDDDDCMEGSGSYPPSYNHSLYGYYSTTSRPWTTWTPPTVSPINRPPIYSPSVPDSGPPFYNTPPPYYYDKNFGLGPHQLRPKTTAPSWTKPVYSVSGPTRPIVNPPIEPQGPPEIYDVPLNIPTVANTTTPSSQIPEVLHRSTNDRTVMIIGMIAICLIVVVIIAPIVLFFKVRLQASEAAYKVENFGPKLATMPIQGTAYPPFAPVVRANSIGGIVGHTGGGLMPPSMMRPGTRPGTPTDIGMKKKDPHEWYV